MSEDERLRVLREVERQRREEEESQRWISRNTMQQGSGLDANKCANQPNPSLKTNETIRFTLLWLFDT